jgi:hypothetical protein
MKKILLLIVILTSGFYISYSYAQRNVAALIYKTFFENMVRISIIKAAPSSNEDIANVNQLNIIRNEMKNIVILKNYATNPNYGGVFKNEKFRLMFIFVKIAEKKHKAVELLYSTEDAIIIAREGDIFPEKRPTKFEEKITVCEFKIPQKVNTILKQCENRLPKEGFYFNSWGVMSLYR